MEGHIFLVGFMGSGKSTVGPVLAGVLRRPFVDLDDRIEQKTGRRILELFQDEGEPEFRKIESETLQEICRWPSSVVSLGGGAFTTPSNRDRASRCGVVIWLDVSLGLAWKRCREDASRPLAADFEGFQHRYQVRLSGYRLAHHRVQVDRKTPSRIARDIISLLDVQGPLTSRNP